MAVSSSCSRGSHTLTSQYARTSCSLTGYRLRGKTTSNFNTSNHRGGRRASQSDQISDTKQAAAARQTAAPDWHAFAAQAEEDYESFFGRGKFKKSCPSYMADSERNSAAWVAQETGQPRSSTAEISVSIYSFIFPFLSRISFHNVEVTYP